MVIAAVLASGLLMLMLVDARAERTCEHDCQLVTGASAATTLIAGKRS
jgi:hypothetical protein